MASNRQKGPACTAGWTLSLQDPADNIFKQGHIKIGVAKMVATGFREDTKLADLQLPDKLPCVIVPDWMAPHPHMSSWPPLHPQPALVQ